MVEPNITQQGVVAALVEEQLSTVLQTGVRFAVLVKVGGVVPASGFVVQEQDIAFSDVDEKADITATAVETVVHQR